VLLSLAVLGVQSALFGACQGALLALYHNCPLSARRKDVLRASFAGGTRRRVAKWQSSSFAPVEICPHLVSTTLTAPQASHVAHSPASPSLHSETRGAPLTQPPGQVDPESRPGQGGHPARIALHGKAEGRPLAPKGIAQPPIERQPAQPSNQVPDQKALGAIVTAARDPVCGHVQARKGPASLQQGHRPLPLHPGLGPLPGLRPAPGEALLQPDAREPYPGNRSRSDPF
jgi:hypothetical protein